jgi:hypothetical protein
VIYNICYCSQYAHYTDKFLLALVLMDDPESLDMAGCYTLETCTHVHVFSRTIYNAVPRSTTELTGGLAIHEYTPMLLDGCHTSDTLLLHCRHTALILC